MIFASLHELWSFYVSSKYVHNFQTILFRIKLSMLCSSIGLIRSRDFFMHFSLNYRIHERVKAAADVDYPAYGVTGPSKDVSPNGGDRKLVQSAHMYHYQHQKQQMAALQKSPLQGEQPGSAGSDVESDDDNEEGDYTVYECPGLAPVSSILLYHYCFPITISCALLLDIATRCTTNNIDSCNHFQSVCLVVIQLSKYKLSTICHSVRAYK